MKKSILVVGLMLVASTQAFAYIRTGLYNIGRVTYYVDGNGSYCQNYAYDNRWRQMTYQETQELQTYMFIGVCGHR